uniref:Uncharacterized protein n=1 Tax=Ditylenchus dipsaci TaxID=166011 RepID=A0A915DN10_9BILA
MLVSNGGLIVSFLFSSASTSQKISLRCLSTEDLDRVKDTSVKQNSSVVKIVFNASGKNAFTSSDVEMRHILDKLPAKEWCLIYDDKIASISHIVAAVGIPFVSINGLSRRSSTQFDDDDWHGRIRMQQLRLFRVYQLRHNPDRFKVFVTKSLIFKKAVDVDRSQIKCVRETIFRRDVFLKLLLLGHIEVGGRRLLINESNFLANNYCSYMLGQSKIVPRDLQSVGFQSNADSGLDKILQKEEEPVRKVVIMLVNARLVKSRSC